MLEKILLITSLITSIITAACLVVQTNIFWRTMRADHERRKKQATIEYVNSIREHYRPISRRLIDKFDDKVINIDDMDEQIKQDIREFLSIVEHLSVGVNTGIYDLEILFRMSEFYFISMFEKLSPYIYDRRQKRSNNTLYCEFEIMVSDIKRIREKRNSQGNIHHAR